MKGLAIITAALVALAIPATGHATTARTGSAVYHHQVTAEVPVQAGVCTADAFLFAGSAGIGTDYEIVKLATLKGERHMSFHVKDHIPGQTIVASWWQGAHRSSAPTVCGGIARPASIHGGYPVYVAVYQTATEHGPSIPTTGVVSASFWR